MIKLGSITGMEFPTGPYTFRRGNGEALNNSSKYHNCYRFFFKLSADNRKGFISESQRNLILQHHNSTGFLKSYLLRYITSDTQAARRGLEPQTALMRIASGMSCIINRQRPRTLNDAQRAEVDQHPKMRLLYQRQKTLFKFIKDQHKSIASIKGTSVYDDYQRAYHDHRNTKRRHEKALLKEVVARYKKEQPVLDIQQQLKALSVVEEETVQTEEYAFIKRNRVIQALFTFATSSLEKECRRRVEAINALTALCRLQEARRPRRPKPSASDIKLEQDTKPPSVLDLPSLSDSIPIECESTQCIFCLGEEGLPALTPQKSFHSSGNLKKHFQRKYFCHHSNSKPIACPHPKCNVELESKMQLQNHAAMVHKTLIWRYSIFTIGYCSLLITKKVLIYERRQT